MSTVPWTVLIAFLYNVNEYFICVFTSLGWI